MNAHDILETVESYRMVDEGALDVSCMPGHDRLILIAGDNATGKSFMVRMLASTLNHGGVTPFQVSMRYRTRGGIERAFMYGPFGDEEESTGLLSVDVVEGGMRSAANSDTPCALFLDEPDIGLSDGYSAAMGEMIGEWLLGIEKTNCQILVVVSHSRQLLSAIEEKIGAQASWVIMGGQDRETWLKEPRRSVEDLRALSSRGRAIRSKINEVIRLVKSEKND